MSNVEPGGSPRRRSNGRPGASRRTVRGNLRFFPNELRLVFFRRRNQLLLARGGAVPAADRDRAEARGAAATAAGGGGGRPSGGAAFFNQLAGNGVFLTFIALSLLLILVLPVVVAVIAGDSIAGEAGYGTLRYLLAVPAGRTRLLAVKYAAIVVWAWRRCSSSRRSRCSSGWSCSRSAR